MERWVKIEGFGVRFVVGVDSVASGEFRWGLWLAWVLWRVGMRRLCGVRVRCGRWVRRGVCGWGGSVVSWGGAGENAWVGFMVEVVLWRVCQRGS